MDTESNTHIQFCKWIQGPIKPHMHTICQWFSVFNHYNTATCRFQIFVPFELFFFVLFLLLFTCAYYVRLCLLITPFIPSWFCMFVCVCGYRRKLLNSHSFSILLPEFGCHACICPCEWTIKWMFGIYKLTLRPFELSEHTHARMGLRASFIQQKTIFFINCEYPKQN